MSRSLAGKVVLEDVNFASSGEYKCEVSSERPEFHTKTIKARMIVYGEYHLSFYTIE